MSSTLNWVDFRTDPGQYRHWRLSYDGPVATLAMDVAEDGGLRPGYKLKLNSYDLGVDIELHDALQRIRFEHPEVRSVVVTSMKERIFCSGANIFMLGLSSHAWKVNFCKFTNETRNGIEDSSRHSGLKFIAALNGACAGGGYELALACDEIMLVDDRSSSVALPEVPLLGVLPGTGGLTRVTDKRKVRHDHADIFCTLVEGVRGQRAKDWRLVDEVVKPARFEQAVRERAQALAQGSDRPADAQGVALTPLHREESADGLSYRYVDVRIDRDKRLAVWTVRAPEGDAPVEIADILAAGAAWWPLQMARELDDAILSMRTNELDIGTWVFKTEGDADRVLAAIEAAGRTAVALPGDLMDADYRAALVDEAAKRLGGLDILVNNAGKQFISDDLTDLTDEQVHETFQINIMSMFTLSRAALKHMGPGSTIVNTTSVQAYNPNPRLLDYAATKGAINNFTKGLAEQLGPKGIRVNAVAPGPIWTVQHVSYGEPEEKLPEFGHSTPIGRAGQPVEMAPAYVFLASGESSYVNGETLNANGGTPTP